MAPWSATQGLAASKSAPSRGRGAGSTGQLSCLPPIETPRIASGCLGTMGVAVLVLEGHVQKRVEGDAAAWLPGFATSALI